MNSQILAGQETRQKMISILLSVVLVSAVSVLYPDEGAFLFIAAMVILAFFLNPRVGFFASLAILPCNNLLFIYQPWPSFSVELQVFFLTTLLTLPGWLLRQAAMKKNTASGYQAASVNTLSVLFMLWSVVAILWSLNVQWGTAILLELFAGIILLFLMQGLVTTRKQVLQLLTFLMAVAFILCILVYSSKWFYGVTSITLEENLKMLLIFFNEDGRPAGFNGSNYAATILNLFIFFGISLLILSKNRITRLLTAAVIFMLITSVVLTGSKGAFGSLIIALFFLDLVLPNIKRKRFFFFVLICTVIVGAFILGTVVLTGKVGSSRVVAVGTTFSVSTRFEWWGQGFAQLFNSYGLGLGTGGLSAVIAPYFAHNLFLSVIFDLGIVGTILFFF